jgi:hypothetical protein
MNTKASHLGKRHSGAPIRILFILAMYCFGLAASAQQVTATINGIVTDPAGRVVTNAIWTVVLSGRPGRTRPGSTA